MRCEEFNIVENPKAEYGWRPGAQISVGMKSGTNTIHGSAFAIGRDTALMTRNPYFPIKTPTPFKITGQRLAASQARQALLLVELRGAERGHRQSYEHNRSDDHITGNGGESIGVAHEQPPGCDQWVDPKSRDQSGSSNFNDINLA